jgi:hypothetical protein
MNKHYYTLYDFHKSSSSFSASVIVTVTTKTTRNNFIFFLSFTFWEDFYQMNECYKGVQLGVYITTFIMLLGCDTSGFYVSHGRILVRRTIEANKNVMTVPSRLDNDVASIYWYTLTQRSWIVYYAIKLWRMRLRWQRPKLLGDLTKGTIYILTPVCITDSLLCWLTKYPTRKSKVWIWLCIQ